MQARIKHPSFRGKAGSVRLQQPSSSRWVSSLFPLALVQHSCLQTSAHPIHPAGRSIANSAALHIPRCSNTSSPTMMCSALDEEQLAQYISTGPLLAVCGISPESVASNMAQWKRLGDRLAQQLDFDAQNLDDVQRLRIYRYYLPVFFWVQEQVQAHKVSGAASPLMLGISAPQGCGKSTVVEQLEALFTWLGHKAASVSIDDFYLTYNDQCQLANNNAANALLQYRGNAGSHDLRLGTGTLRSLKGLSKAGDKLALPRYDKSAHAGRGDRAPVSAWPVVEGPVEVVFFEGWMSGFAPVSDAQAAAVDTDLVKVNQLLRPYKEAWDSLVDSWLVIRIGDPQWVFKWRLQAEERMKASGKAGMTDVQIADFVARFMPAYQAYLPGLYSSGPTTAQKDKTLIIEVDAQRAPVAEQPAPVA